MKATLNHSMRSEENLAFLNQFMQIVEKSDSPLLAVSKLYDEGMVPGKSFGSGYYPCVIRLYPGRIEFRESNGVDEVTIAYVEVGTC